MLFLFINGLMNCALGDKHEISRLEVIRAVIYKVVTVSLFKIIYLEGIVIVSGAEVALMPDDLVKIKKLVFGGFVVFHLVLLECISI